ncbi:MAG: radical SAM protein [Planctomycetota bacterium]|nr:radical SAM protein [Planctomycetota bacterium]
MARQRVVLVNPPALAIVEPWYDRPDWGRIGLAYLAAWLKRDPDVEVVVVDAKLERLTFEQVQSRVATLEADVVGFTAFTNEIKPAAYTASLIKDLLPKAVTVIGGVHVTALPRQTIEEFSSFDVAVIGEGERTLEELCSAIRRGEDWSDVAGLVYRSDSATPDGLVQTIARPRMLDQDLLPLPAWDLFPPMKSFWLQTVRGCPFNCVFCMNHNGRIARSRSVQNVVAEIRWLLDEYGIGDLRFGDELFTVDMERSRELMEALIESGLSERIRWDCQTHVRFVDESLLRLMKQAGCYRVELGIETGDEEKLRTLGKGTNLKMILAAAEAARRAGLSFGTFFIIGQPHENSY